MDKCTNNESPPNCPQSNICKYVIWDSNSPYSPPDLCQLASETCDLIDKDPKAMSETETWMKKFGKLTTNV